MVLAAATALSPGNAEAYAGGQGNLTLEDLHRDIVFRQGVAETKTISLTVNLHPSSVLCNGELAAEITIPGVIEAEQPCYGGDMMSTLPGIDGGTCFPGVGTGGTKYSFGGGNFVVYGGTTTFDLQLRYDGSSTSVTRGEWILYSDGLCHDLYPTTYREVGSINIQILPSAATHEDGFVATSAGSTYNYFYLDHPQLNWNRDANPIVTPMAWDETPTDKNTGVWYNTSTGRWSIYLEDGSTMANGRDFVVAIGNDRAFVHKAEAGNVSGNVTYIDHDLLNDNPYAAVFVTHNYNPPGAGYNYHDHPVGVWYSTSRGQWAIYNDDLATMPVGATFNVVAASDFDGGIDSQIGLWPTEPPPFHGYTPPVLTHNYAWPSSGYFPHPTTFLVETLWCWMFGCVTDDGPAGPGGLVTDSTQFFAWVPFGLTPY